MLCARRGQQASCACTFHSLAAPVGVELDVEMLDVALTVLTTTYDSLAIPCLERLVGR
jgi:hypothetical protein